MEKRIIIAGSRDFSDYDLLEKTLSDYIKDKENTTIISGTAKGADSLGEKYANRHGISLIKCPADWKRYGRGAGIIRNKEMAVLSMKDNNQGVLFAFWNGESRGTKQMIRFAEENGLEIHIINF